MLTPTGSWERTPTRRSSWLEGDQTVTGSFLLDSGIARRTAIREGNRSGPSGTDDMKGSPTLFKAVHQNCLAGIESVLHQAWRLTVVCCIHHLSCNTWHELSGGELGIERVACVGEGCQDWTV
ncbi:hypothetical protein FOFC_02821 [Fusarium oxysporum]|nr:hypothetical protein FOFC_02821 [Fusarium oxysporum]